MGVKSRRRHRLVRRTYISLGPNHLWHIDGYNKLHLYVVGCLSTETGSVPPTVLLNMFNQAYFLRCGRVNSLRKSSMSIDTEFVRIGLEKAQLVFVKWASVY